MPLRPPFLEHAEGQWSYPGRAIPDWKPAPVRQPIGSPGVVTITYSYDPLYRLTSASYSSRETYSYSYDAVGNRLTMVYPGGTVNYTYDVANRLTSAGGQTYTWDDNGNLLSDGVRTYQYDHANRLKQVTE
ncbi:MAG: hypothetical protein GTO63_34385, partial [Anaerolineae bacterium]|nr:hypothetical protein [Anaerolineae bacterium]NIN99740.1 hypothetical protein [Anaerolineae bacterium]NIQ82577.1 hypothetical protein [Anaerolineae bacterium]